MTNVLPYHVGPENRYSLEFVSPDYETFKEQLAERTTNEGTSYKSREIPIEGDGGPRSLYAIYSNAVPQSALEPPSTEEIGRILDTVYTNDQLQVLGVVIDVFSGITEATVEEAGRFTIYKELALRKIPDVLDHPDWGNAPVTVVGGQLLSRFILAHPMPNANHRTAIGLLERYLRSTSDQLSVPETGQHGVWYEWARPYIHDSKRHLTVRRNAHTLRYAREFGVDVVRRKNDVEIDLHEYDLSVDDPFAHFGARHEARSIEFVETILEHSPGDTTRVETATDAGWEAFVDALRTD